MEKVINDYIVESCLDDSKMNYLKNYISLLKERNLHYRVLCYMSTKYKITFKILRFLFGKKYVDSYVLELIKDKIETKIINNLIK